MLVVIAIISILIGIGINTFTIAQKKARDVRRKADLANIKKALVAFSLDNNGSYCPEATPGSGCSLTPLQTKGYLSSIPSDPLTGNPSYYFVSSPTTTFILSAKLENAADGDILTITCTPSTTAYNYCMDEK